MTFPEPFSFGASSEAVEAGLKARAGYILDQVAAGAFEPLVWVPVTTSAKGHEGSFYVTADALKVEGVRVNVDALTAQLLASRLGASLNTSRTSDLAWEQAAVRLRPEILGASIDMASTKRMVQHSSQVDAKLAGQTGLVRTVGKDWIIAKAISANPATQAVNYGWHDPRAPYLSPSGLHMWQTIGTRHNTAHVDYSQILTLVRGDMLVDGVSRDLEDVLRDSELAALVSDEGPLRVTSYATGAE